MLHWVCGCGRFVKWLFAPDELHAEEVSRRPSWTVHVRTLFSSETLPLDPVIERRRRGVRFRDIFAAEDLPYEADESTRRESRLRWLFSADNTLDDPSDKSTGNDER